MDITVAFYENAVEAFEALLEGAQHIVVFNLVGYVSLAFTFDERVVNLSGQLEKAGGEKIMPLKGIFPQMRFRESIDMLREILGGFDELLISN